MEETAHNKNRRTTLSFYRRAKTLYFMTLAALFAASAIGYLLMPTGSTISAQSGNRDIRDLITLELTENDELSKPEMIGGAPYSSANDFSEFGLVGVCKIAGPGIPLNTIFTFRVIGRGPIDAAGTIGDVDRTVEVAAGIPSEGGICAFVPGFGTGAGNAEVQTFVIGTSVTITENPQTVNNGQIRVSRVRSTTEANRPSEFVVNFVARTYVEVEFTNFLFRPTILKVCKVAGTGVATGTPFTFTTTLVSPTGAGGNLFPAFSATTTVNAGVASHGGNCSIVNGSGLIGGAFNQGSTVTITENAAVGTVVSNITSPTSTIPAFVPGVRSTTLTGDQGLVEGVTQVTFTNSLGCSFSIFPLYIDAGPSAGSSSFSVNTGAECNWTAVSNASWITITSGTGGSGSGIVTFSFTANLTGAARVGSMVAGGRGVSVFQYSAPTRTAFDFDGDRKADISVFRPSNGVWYLSNSQTGFYAAQWGASTDTLVPGDYDGDGRTDLAVFRKSADSTWYILNSATNTFRAARWGASNIEQAILFDRVVPGDYDGDGKTDLAVWRLTDAINLPAQFLILQSSDNTSVSRQLGGFGDSLVPAADYDGDGRADLTVRRGSDWHILQSQNNQPRIVQFGFLSDKAVPADYDGDGKADVAVVRDGTWYLQRSRDGFLGYQFGFASDVPVPADYDGDGKADIAVFRGGAWYLQRSQAGFTAVAFGAPADKPVPGAFNPYFQ